VDIATAPKTIPNTSFEHSFDTCSVPDEEMKKMKDHIDFYCPSPDNAFKIAMRSHAMLEHIERPRRLKTMWLSLLVRRRTVLFKVIGPGNMTDAVLALRSNEFGVDVLPLVAFMTLDWEC